MSLSFVVYFFLTSSHSIIRQPRVISSYNDLLSARQQSKKTETHTLMFGGDVMLARHVQQLQKQAGSLTTAWNDIADKFNSADIAVVNLESPFSDQPPYPTEGFVFKAMPENISGLLAAGIDAVQLANNHFGNGGVYGMNFTFSHLNKNDITYVGAGENKNNTYTGEVIERDGLRVGLVAQSYDVPWYAVKQHTPGIAVFDPKKLVSAITDLENQDVDLIVAMYHGGIEYVRDPNTEQVMFAHAAIDAGADLVIMHHPHWIQTVEQYNGAYIFYSLGNLIFDQNWSVETSQGLVLKVNVINKKIDNFELLPVVIEENFKPRWADEVETEKILADIDQKQVILVE